MKVNARQTRLAPRLDATRWNQMGVYYAEEHKSLPSAEAGKTVDSLVAAGILSEQDAVFIRDHHIQFRGVDPAEIGADIVVMESVFTNTRMPRRIIGYADGHVSTSELEMRK